MRRRHARLESATQHVAKKLKCIVGRTCWVDGEESVPALFAFDDHAGETKSLQMSRDGRSAHRGNLIADEPCAAFTVRCQRIQNLPSDLVGQCGERQFFVPLSSHLCWTTLPDSNMSTLINISNRGEEGKRRRKDLATRYGCRASRSMPVLAWQLTYSYS